MKKLMCILDNGFEELEAIGSMALLKRAGIEVDIYTLCGSEASGRFGFTLSHLNDFEDVDMNQYDGLLLPGGPHYASLEASEEVKNCIHLFNNEEKLIAAICASPTILGHMGLLEGKNYTCFTSMNEDFKGQYQDVYAITCGNIITGRSAAASIDFGFEIIRYLLGEEKEAEVKASIYY